MFSIFNSGTSLVRQGYAVAVIDLILANLAVVIGFTQAYPPTLHFSHNGQGWFSLILQILQLPVTFFLPNATSQHLLLLFCLCTFVVEACLSILLIHGTQKLEGSRLRIWFRIRLMLFLLTFVSLVIRTVNLRHVDDPVVILQQGVLGIGFMVYRGYGLIVVTFLEELAYKSLAGTTYHLV